MVGGGVVGASTAYHLARLGAGAATLLLESNSLTSGTTWHSAAMINSLRGDVVDGLLAAHTKNLVTSVLEEETGVSPGFKRHGGLTVTSEPQMITQFLRERDVARYTSNQALLLSPSECRAKFPSLDTTGLLGGIYCETDGSVDPTGLTRSYIKGAQAGGVTVREDCGVKDIMVEAGRVTGVLTDHDEIIRTGKVVLAAGAWSGLLTEKIGIKLPLVASEHSYIVTDIIPHLPDNIPNLRIPDHAIYAKVQNQTLFLGAFEANPNPWEPVPGFAFGQFNLNMEAYLPYLEAFQARLPMLEDVGHRTAICGPESFTPDGYPLFGEVAEVRGLYLNCALNSRGVQMSGGLGREMAELVVKKRTSLDLHRYDIKRFPAQLRSDRQWVADKTQERHVKTYHVPVPWDQPLAQRGVLTSPLHQHTKAAGAFFAVAAGWERPQFFWKGEESLELLEYDHYGYFGHTPHANYPYRDILQQKYARWEISEEITELIRSECEQCRNNFVIFDSSAFGKILVSGPGALQGLQWLCTNNLGAEARCVYTLMLNDEAGVEADLTVTRLAEDRFYLVTSISSLEHVLHWVKTGLEDAGYAEAVVEDVTRTLGVINVQGPKSRDFLQHFFPDLNLKFSRMERREVGGEEVMVVRLSYVGELGYELHLAASACPSLLEAMLAQGTPLHWAGAEAMESLAVEAGYRHWPQDISQTDSPLEAGLGWLCSQSKQFRGAARLRERERRGGASKTLICLTVKLLSGVQPSDPILYNGQIVGYIRRAQTGGGSGVIWLLILNT